DARHSRSMTIGEHGSAFPRRESARVLRTITLKETRGRGEYRVPNAPAASCALCSFSMHTSIHSGGTGNIRHSPRNGFTAYIVLSPGTGLFCPRRFAGITPQTLAPASGRQDHTTLPSASGSPVKRAAASTASRSASVTLRNAPLRSGTVRTLQLILASEKAKYFCGRG